MMIFAEVLMWLLRNNGHSCHDLYGSGEILLCGFCLQGVDPSPLKRQYFYQKNTIMEKTTNNVNRFDKDTFWQDIDMYNTQLTKMCRKKLQKVIESSSEKLRYTYMHISFDVTSSNQHQHCSQIMCPQN